MRGLLDRVLVRACPWRAVEAMPTHPPAMALVPCDGLRAHACHDQHAKLLSTFADDQPKGPDRQGEKTRKVLVRARLCMVRTAEESEQAGAQVHMYRARLDSRRITCAIGCLSAQARHMLIDSTVGRAENRVRIPRQQEAMFEPCVLNLSLPHSVALVFGEWLGVVEGNAPQVAQVVGC